MKRILVIEDDKDIVELVRYNLEKDGFQVLSSGDGATGLAQIRKSPPDLVILDLMLPKFSGLDICKEVGTVSLLHPTIYKEHDLNIEIRVEVISRRKVVAVGVVVPFGGIGDLGDEPDVIAALIGGEGAEIEAGWYGRPRGGRR